MAAGSVSNGICELLEIKSRTAGALASALPPDAIEVAAGRVSNGICELFEIRSQGKGKTEGVARQLQRALLLVRWARRVVVDRWSARCCWCGGRGASWSRTRRTPTSSWWAVSCLSVF